MQTIAFVHPKTNKLQFLHFNSNRTTHKKNKMKHLSGLIIINEVKRAQLFKVLRPCPNGARFSDNKEMSPEKSQQIHSHNQPTKLGGSFFIAQPNQIFTEMQPKTKSRSR